VQSQEGRNLGKYSGVHNTQRRIWCHCCSALSAFTAQQVCLASCPIHNPLAYSLPAWPSVYESMLSVIYLSVASAIINNLHSLLVGVEQLVSWLLHTFGTYQSSISMREIAHQTFFTSISTLDCLKLVTKHFQALRTKPANSLSKTYVRQGHTYNSPINPGVSIK
jgi:hypothetical protein